MRGSIIFIKSSQRWRGAVDLPVPKGSPRKPKYFYGDTSKSSAKEKKEVESKMNQFYYELDNNLYLNESDLTVEQYLLSWFKTYTVSLQETTRELYKIYIDKHIAPEIGHLQIKKLLPIELQEFYNFKLETLSGKTVGKLHSFLNHTFKDAMTNRIIKYNPCDGVVKPKAKKFKAVLYSEDDFNKLADITSGTFDEVCILLAGVCGLRRGEIFGLRLQDIDFKKSRISIVETMVRMNGDWIIKDPKSETSQRDIKIPQFVIDVISDYLKTLRVVPERICGQFKPSSYSHHFKKLLSDNDLPHIRFHDLRHFCASTMMRHGVRDKIAAERLGHSQIQMTRQYQHSSSDMDNEASGVMEDIFAQRKKAES